METRMHEHQSLAFPHRVVRVLREEGLRVLVLRALHSLGVHRRLLVFAGPDPRRAPPPSIPLQLADLGPDEIDEYLAYRPDQDAAEIRTRFAEGQWCFVARHAGRIIASGWAARERVFIDHVGCWLLLRDDAVFLHDDWVRPELRGRGLTTAVEGFRRRFAEERGCKMLVAVVLEQNRAAFRHSVKSEAYASGRLHSWRLGPFRRFSLRLEPSPWGQAVALPRDPAAAREEPFPQIGPRPAPMAPDVLTATSDGQGTLEPAFATGRGGKADISRLLPPEIAALDLRRLCEEYGDAPAQLTAPPEVWGQRVRLADLCAPLLEENSGDHPWGSPQKGNAVLCQMSTELARAVEAMPIFSSWREMTTLFWINSTSGLHFDAWDSLLIQLNGRKKLTLYPPEVTREFLGRGSIFPREQADGLLVGPEGTATRHYETWLEPGEAFAIPAGAMHSLDGPNSASLACFLRGGPRPLHRELAVAYHLRETWPSQFSRLVPAPLRRAAATQGFHYFESHVASKEVVPRIFRRR